MRCTNCGWDNSDQNTRCEKCNAPLEGIMQNKLGSPAPETIPETIRETLREDQSFPIKTIIDSNEPAPAYSPVPPVQEPTQPHEVGNGFGKTINPWAAGAYIPMMSYCKLVPMPLAPNEKHLPREVELKGEYNELNRGNIDPDNFAISQTLQAVLTCKDGKWFIKDQSPYKTTFGLASAEIPLKDGDVILMGNRRFVFTEE